MLWDPKNDKPIEVELDEIGQVMWKAADYLETHKWGQGDFVLANGAVCLMGALIKIEMGRVYSCKKEPIDQESECLIASLALKRMENLLKGDLLPSIMHSPMYDWNDDPKRKKAEVIAVLREAAKLK